MYKWCLYFISNTKACIIVYKYDYIRIIHKIISEWYSDPTWNTDHVNKWGQLTLAVNIAILFPIDIHFKREGRVAVTPAGAHRCVMSQGRLEIPRTARDASSQRPAGVSAMAGCAFPDCNPIQDPPGATLRSHFPKKRRSEMCVAERGRAVS